MVKSSSVAKGVPFVRNRSGLVVKIGVYRIYLGQSWHASGRAAALTALFDSIPEFLYRIDTADPADLPADRPDAAAMQAHVRIAMTQSHIVLIDADAPATAQAVTDLEIELARDGFRRRLPVLAVTTAAAPSALTLDGAGPAGFDDVVGFSATPLTCAIQELAEAAGATARAQTREAVRAAVSRPVATANREPGVTIVAGPQTDDARPRQLPVESIAQAFRALRASAPAKGTGQRQGS